MDEGLRIGVEYTADPRTLIYMNKYTNIDTHILTAHIHS